MPFQVARSPGLSFGPQTAEALSFGGCCQATQSPDFPYFQLATAPDMLRGSWDGGWGVLGWWPLAASVPAPALPRCEYLGKGPSLLGPHFLHL